MGFVDNYIKNHDIRKIAVSIIIFGLSLLTFIHLTIAAFQERSLDFYAFLTGAKILVENKQELYNPYVQYQVQEELFKEGFAYERAFMAYINLPLSAVPYIPFLIIPPHVSAELVHLGTLLILIYCITRLYKFHKIKPLSGVTLVLAFFYPLYSSIHLAQIGTLILLVLTEMYLAYMKRQTTKLSLLASLLILKIQYLPIVAFIYAIHPERKKYICIAGPLTLIFLAANYFIMGPDLVAQYIALLETYQTVPERFGMAYEKGLDIYSTLQYFFDVSEKMKFVLPIFLGAHLAMFSFMRSYKFDQKRKDLLFYFIILYSLILSPHTMAADFVFLIIPIIGLLHKTRSKVFYAITVFVLSLFFFYTAYATQWAHTIMISIYALLLLSSTLKKPGKIGRWVQNSMVGDPGLEPGTARV
mgnify:CR=1 FL=1